MGIRERVLNTSNARHAFEYLQLINEAPTEAEQLTLLKKWGGTVPLSMVLSLNFNKNVAFDLPEGTPPYKRDEATHFDLFSPLGTQIGRLKICLKNVQARKLDKERVFIQVLENISPEEGDVLIFAKDKALHERYPNITPELVAKAFPQYVLA